MFLIDQKCVTLLTHISPITSSKIIHFKTQSFLFKKSPTLVALMLFSVPTNRGESCSCLRPILNQLLQVSLHSEPILHLAHSPSQPTKQTRTSAFHHPSASQSVPAHIPKQSTQNPLAVAQVTIGNWSLATACQTPVHWPQRTVSSHSGVTTLLLIVSCKTVWKTFLKSRQTDNHCFFPTNKVCCCVSGGKEIGFRWFTPDKYMPAVLLTSFPSRVLWSVVWLFVPCISRYTTWLQIPRFSCSSLLRIDTIFALFPFSRTSPVLHDFFG